MKNFVVVLLMSIFSFHAMADLASNICDPTASRATLISDWKKDNQRNEVCAEANCMRDGKSIPREKCIGLESQKGKENTVVVRYSEFITTGNVSSMGGRMNRIVVGKDDQCFSSCNPRGIKKRECLDCFKNRTDTIYDETINYPEIGRPLLRGTKCHELCKDPEGPFTNQRVLPVSCQQCLTESFEYMVVSSGRCFEVDKDKKYRLVSEDFCKNSSQLIHTTFEIDKTWAELFTGGAGRCLELDDKTFGEIYKVSAERVKCDPTPINNSDRSNVSDKDIQSPSQNANRATSSPQ